MNELESRLGRSAKRIGEPPEAVASQFFDAAERSGLVDVAYATVDSPVGPWTVAATARGLIRLARGESDEVLHELSRKVSPRIVRSAGRVEAVRRELDEYFEGRRRNFDVPLDWSLVRGFNRKVLRATARIPYGSVSTYSDVARNAGSARAARAAGNALHNNPIPVIVPCHRVLHSSGGLGGYGGRLEVKEFLLKLEYALGD